MLQHFFFCGDLWLGVLLLNNHANVLVTKPARVMTDSFHTLFNFVIWCVMKTPLLIACLTVEQLTLQSGRYGLPYTLNVPLWTSIAAFQYIMCHLNLHLLGRNIFAKQ